MAHRWIIALECSCVSVLLCVLVKSKHRQKIIEKDKDKSDKNINDEVLSIVSGDFCILVFEKT